MQNWIRKTGAGSLVIGDAIAACYLFSLEDRLNSELVIKGQYPHARYMAFTVTAKADGKSTRVYDWELIPDSGSINPFSAGSDWDATDRAYTLIITPASPPGPYRFVPGTGCNTIYTGALPEGDIFDPAAVSYSICLPGIGYDDTGGAGLPEIVSSLRPSSPEAELEVPALDIPPVLTGCQDIVAAAGGMLAYDFGWFTPIRSAHTQQVSPSESFTLVSGELDRDPDKLLYLHWKAPTVPDTWHNIGLTGKEDMRCWCMTFVDLHSEEELKTIADYQFVLDHYGYINLVIGFGTPRPAMISPANGYTWLDLGGLPPVPTAIVYQNVLISPGFKYGPEILPNGSADVMQLTGDYYPRGSYISRI